MSGLMDPGEEQFFEQGEEPQLVVPEEPELVVEPSGMSERRARLQRVVGAALLGSAALFGVGLMRHYAASRVPLATSKTVPRITLAALLPSSPATPSASALNLPEPSATPEPSSTVSAPTVDPATLIRTARALLEAGHTRDGVVAARAAVSASPSDAEPYILLAAGLQDLGKWAEAQTVFTTCKQATSSGPNATCRYFAGR
jgi:hypothetical protein